MTLQSKFTTHTIIALLTAFFLCNNTFGQLSLCDNPTVKMLKNTVEEPDIHRVYGSQVIHNSKLYFTFDDGVHGVELWTSDGSAGGTHMVSDINLGTFTSGIDHLVVMDDVLYFKADNGVQGGELYKLDLSVANATPQLVADIFPGAGCSCPDDLTVVGSTLYFTAYVPSTGRELYKATASGVTIVKDITTGSESSNTFDFKSAIGKLFFIVRTSSEGIELWTSDGSSAGTTILYDFAPGPNSGAQFTNDIVEFGSHIYFQALDNNSKSVLWKSDGSTLGTSKVKKGPLVSDSFNPQGITAAGPLLFMSGSGIGIGTELFQCDGDSVYLAKDIRPGGVNSYPYGLTAIGNSIFFRANDGTHGSEPWISNGTTIGTKMVTDLNPGTSSSNPQKFTYVDGQIFFETNDATNGSRVWTSDGIGTSLMASLGPDRVHEVLGTEVEFYFTYGKTNQESELYYSDGTTNGTGIFHEIQPGSSGSFPQNFITNKSIVFFQAHNSSTGMELYSFLESGSCSSMGDNSSLPSHTKGISSLKLFDWGEKALFSFNYTDTTEEDIYELWQTDGTTSGTNKLEINFENNRLYIADFGPNFIAIWEDINSDNYKIVKSDGTLSGTSTIIEYVADEEISYFGKIKNKALFTLEDDTSSSLWSINELGALTQLASNFSGQELDEMKVIDGIGYIVTYTDADIYQLWATDGTVSGTLKIKEMPTGLKIENMDHIDGTIILLVESINSSGGGPEGPSFKSNMVDGVQVWVSDGTSSGTVLLSSIDPSKTVNINDVLHLPNAVLFSLEGPSNFNNAKSMNPEDLAGVWVTDGTAVGTIQLRSAPNARLQASVSNNAYFVEDNNDSLRFYVTDGTISETKEISLEFPEYFGSVNGLNFKESSSAYSLGGQAIFGDVSSCQGSQVYSLILTSETWLPIIDNRDHTENGLGSTDGVIELGDRMITFIGDGISGIEPYVIDCSCNDNQLINDQQMKSGVYNSGTSINLSGATLQNSDVKMKSGMEIVIDAALEVKQFSTLEINIGACNN